LRRTARVGDVDDRDAAPPDPDRAASKERPEPPSRRRVSRRAVLTGGVTGLLGLGAGYAAGTADAGETPPTGLAASPLVLAAPDRRVPHGVVRADLRAFAAGADGDFQPALARALAAADAVYVPPGIWPVRRPVEVGRGK